MVTRMAKNPKPIAHVLSERFSDPDLVDFIFEYIATQIPEFRHANLREAQIAVRDHFGGIDKAYVRTAHAERRAELVRQVLSLFNGRNASEVARRLHISRATVYRVIKQPGAARGIPS
jgi:Mor family transcriptional regulator